MPDRGGKEWDIWDDAKKTWHPTGVACNPLANAWNHLVIQVQRTSNNHLLYQSITLNGETHTLNWTYAPYSAPGWHGITINYHPFRRVRRLRRPRSSSSSVS